jgi:4,5-dihydroxyphthalate decarboxylase
VDLGRITWVLSGDEHVLEYRPPPNVVSIESGKKLEDMLSSGEIGAAIGVQVDHPDVRPLIPNALEAGFAALRERQLYPINHTLVVRDDLLSAHSDLASDIFQAFAGAKRLYLDRLNEGQIHSPSASDRLFQRVASLTGDPLPYGIGPNRVVLEAIVQYCVEQGITSRPFSVEELFEPSTRALTA